MSLDIYDDRPLSMKNYLKYYGWHFNLKMLEFAVARMIKGNLPIVPLTKSMIDSILRENNIVLTKNQLYDYIYVANMCKADFMGSSIVDDTHLAKYVKDVIDDEDGYDGLVFSRWYIDTVKKGIPIDWDSML